MNPIFIITTISELDTCGILCSDLERLHIPYEVHRTNTGTDIATAIKRAELSQATCIFVSSVVDEVLPDIICKTTYLPVVVIANENNFSNFKLLPVMLECNAGLFAARLLSSYDFSIKNAITTTLLKVESKLSTKCHYDRFVIAHDLEYPLVKFYPYLLHGKNILIISNNFVVSVFDVFECRFAKYDGFNDVIKLPNWPTSISCLANGTVGIYDQEGNLTKFNLDSAIDAVVTTRFFCSNCVSLLSINNINSVNDKKNLLVVLGIDQSNLQDSKSNLVLSDLSKACTSKTYMFNDFVDLIHPVVGRNDLLLMHFISNKIAVFDTTTFHYNDIITNWDSVSNIKVFKGFESGNGVGGVCSINNSGWNYIDIFDILTLRHITSVSFDKSVQCFAIHPLKDELAVATSDGLVKIIDYKSKEIKHTFKEDYVLTSLGYSCSGDFIVGVNLNGECIIYTSNL